MARYLKTDFSENALVHLVQDGKEVYIPVKNLCIGPASSGKAIKTQKQLQQAIDRGVLHSTRGGRPLTLAEAEKGKPLQLYKEMKSSVYNVQRFVNGDAKAKISSMLNVQSFAKSSQENMFSVDVKDVIFEINDVEIPLANLTVILPNGTERNNLELSEIITLMADKRTKFIAKGLDGETLSLPSNPFTADFLEKMKSVKEGDIAVKVQVPKEVVTKIDVDVTKIYAVDADGKVSSTPVASTEELYKLILAKTKFRVKEGDNYFEIDNIPPESLCEVRADSKYILVQLKGDNARTICPIENLRLDDGTGKPSSERITNFHNCFNKKIWAVDAAGVQQELEPITPDQFFSGTYQERLTMQETFSADNIAKDDAETGEASYLRLKNGKYVKESEVAQPICYDYAASGATNFDAYLITEDKGTSHERCYVVPKSTIDGLGGGATAIAVRGDVVHFNPADAVKVVRSKGGINNCDVVQTSSNGNKCERCEVLSKRVVSLSKDALTDEDKQLLSQIKEIYQKFLVDYKNKNYDLDKVLVNGEFEEYLRNHRYLLSNSTLMKDFGSEKLAEYANMKGGEQTFDGEKFEGGPKYDFKYACGNSFATLGKITAYFAGFTFSAGGVVTTAVSPLILPIIAGGLAIAAIAIPIYHRVKKSRIERQNYEFKSKANIQNQEVKNSVYADIQKLIEDVKRTDPAFQKEIASLSAEEKQKRIEARKNNFLSEMSLIEFKLDLLDETKSGAMFRVADGKASVNQGNAHEFSEYRKEMLARVEQIQNLQSTIKQLETKAAKDPSASVELNTAKNQLDLLTQELEEKKQNFVSSGTDNEPDSKLDEIKERVAQAKGFMLAKYLGKELDATLQKIVDHTDIDVLRTDDSIDFEYSYLGTRKEKDYKKTWREYMKHHKAEFLAKLLNNDERYDLENNIVKGKNPMEHAEELERALSEELEHHTEEVREASHEAGEEAEVEEEAAVGGDAEVAVEEEPATEEPASSDGKKDGDGESIERKTGSHSLTRFINYYSKYDFKEMFKLIEINNANRRKALALDAEKKQIVKNFVEKYEEYKDELQDKITALESKPKRTEKQNEQLKKLQDFKNEADYLIHFYKTIFGYYKDSSITI